MAAGADEHLRIAVPLLEQLGQSVGIVATEPSQANLVKLIGNFMLSVVIETLGEACAVAGKAGMDPMHLVELLTGATFDAPPYKIYGALIATRRFQPAGFSLPLGQKDNRLMLAAAGALGVLLPLASLVRDRFLAVRSQGLGAETDWSALALCALGEAGLDRRNVVDAGPTPAPGLSGLLEGGVPDIADGHVIGPVGVSGVKPDQDSKVARAGATLSFKLD
jgi:hypothetical protein